MFLPMLAIEGAQRMMDVGQSCRGVVGEIEGQMYSPGARGGRLQAACGQEANLQIRGLRPGLGEEEKPQPLQTILAF